MWQLSRGLSEYRDRGESGVEEGHQAREGVLHQQSCAENQREICEHEG